MKVGSGLQYLLTDHLGSLVAITNDIGSLTSQQRFLPFGQARADVTTPNGPSTDLSYTGQRDLGMGLLDYHARFYSPCITRFSQPDTIVPDPLNPQAWNRYSYALNNPIRYNDPTGHIGCDEDLKGKCISGGYEYKQKTNKKLHDELDSFVEPERVSDSEMVYSYYFQKLAPKEIEVLRNHYGLGEEPFFMYASRSLARSTAGKYYPDLDGSGFLQNDPGDAYRHAFWSALLTRTYGEDFARDFTTAHETEANNEPDAREQSFMDLHNNEIGIQIALSNPNASGRHPSAAVEELEVQIYDALQTGQLYVWDGSDIYYSDACPYCIYP